MGGVVEIVYETPCFECLRLARYTGFHRADEALLTRLRQPISHRDVHDIAAILEAQHEQVPIGVCACGALGQESTSAEFSDRAVREDLNYVADDLSYEMVRLSLDGKILWESDLEQWRQGLDKMLDVPNPTLGEAIEKSEQCMVGLNAIQVRLHAAFMMMDDPPGAEYVRSKARLHCRIGTEAYRKADALKQPDKRLSPEHLAAVALAMHQLADGRGFSAANPLEVPAEHSHAVFQTVHFEVVAQMARRSEDGRFFIDALVGKHMIDGREVTIFNRVPIQKGEPS